MSIHPPTHSLRSPAAVFRFSGERGVEKLEKKNQGGRLHTFWNLQTTTYLFNEHHSIKSYNKAVSYGESQKLLCSIGAKFEAEVVTEP